MVDQAEDSELRVRLRGREISLAISEEQAERVKVLARRILREPFTQRPWSELAFYLVSGGLAVFGLAFVGITMVAGVVLAITFFGLAILALSLRSARGLGGWNRGLARSLLGEPIGDPEPFAGRRGFLGWLQSSLRDRVGWRAVGYLALKVPWTVARGSTSRSACGGTRSSASPIPSSPPGATACRSSAWWPTCSPVSPTMPGASGTPWVS